MAYIKKIWKDYPDATTPILASDMNNIENGIEAADTALENIENNVNNIGDGLETVTNNVNNGWISLTGTFTYSSADSPTFVVTTSVDLTGIVGLGMRIKLTQATTQYFIVTAITNDSITMYGGTDYSINSSAISNVYYSMLKAPFGFPLSEDKWSVIITDTTARDKSSPETTVWYNLGEICINVPIGYFKLSYSCLVAGTRASSAIIPVSVTLGESASTSLAVFTRKIESKPATQHGFSSLFAEDNVLLTAKKTYYFNISAGTSGLSGIYEGNSQQTLIIKAICKYL